MSLTRSHSRVGSHQQSSNNRSAGASPVASPSPMNGRRLSPSTGSNTYGSNLQPTAAVQSSWEWASTSTISRHPSSQRLESTLVEGAAATDTSYAGSASPAQSQAYTVPSTPFSSSNGSHDTSHPTPGSVDELGSSLRVISLDTETKSQSPILYDSLTVPNVVFGSVSQSPTFPTVSMLPHETATRATNEHTGAEIFARLYQGPPALETLTRGVAATAYRHVSDTSFSYSSATSGTRSGPNNVFSPIMPSANVHQQIRTPSATYVEYTTHPYYYPQQTPQMYPTSTVQSPVLTRLGVSNAAMPVVDPKSMYQSMHYGVPQTGHQHAQHAMVPQMASPAMSQIYPTSTDFSPTHQPYMMQNMIYATPSPPQPQQAIQVFSPGFRSVNIVGEASLVATAARSRSHRTKLLDEFRSTKAVNWELRHLFGHIVEFSGDQHGSRFIQQKLQTATQDEKNAVFHEIVPYNVLQLSIDVFGNYVVQKLFEHGTQAQKNQLFYCLQGHFTAISVQMYGCRVAQKALEQVTPEQQSMIVRELEPHITRCVRDSNGNHVIQKMLQRVNVEQLTFIHTFRNNILDLSTHPYGCRVLQRCFEFLPETEIRPLLDELHRYTVPLTSDQFGNYVLQFVLEKGPQVDRDRIVKKLRGSLMSMARHKFASNVCETALKSANREDRRVLIDEILNARSDHGNPITQMIRDQYANYVLQTSLRVAEGEQQAMLILRVRPHLNSLRRYSNSYGKHLASLERIIGDLTSQDNEQAL